MLNLAENQPQVGKCLRIVKCAPYIHLILFLHQIFLHKIWFNMS